MRFLKARNSAWTFSVIIMLKPANSRVLVSQRMLVRAATAMSETVTVLPNNCDHLKKIASRKASKTSKSLRSVNNLRSNDLTQPL